MAFYSKHNISNFTIITQLIPIAYANSQCWYLPWNLKFHLWSSMVYYLHTHTWCYVQNCQVIVALYKLFLSHIQMIPEICQFLLMTKLPGTIHQTHCWFTIVFNHYQKNSFRQRFCLVNMSHPSKLKAHL